MKEKEKQTGIRLMMFCADTVTATEKTNLLKNKAVVAETRRSFLLLNPTLGFSRAAISATYE